MNLLGIESSSRKLSIGLMKDDSFSELHSEKINDTANSGTCRFQEGGRRRKEIVRNSPTQFANQAESIFASFGSITSSHC